MSYVDSIGIALAIGIAFPLIMHRIENGSRKDQELREIEKWDCTPERIAWLEKWLEDVRPIIDPDKIAEYEASIEVRRRNARKYWNTP